MKRPVVVSIVNHKGGCFKTSVTANLGAALARVGKQVLVVDLDAQQNLTQNLLGVLDVSPEEPTLLSALLDEGPIDGLIRGTAQSGLDIVPCGYDFACAELTMASAIGRENLLKACLANSRALSRYDFVLLDNPPSLSLVVVNGLVASDLMLVPCKAEYFHMMALTLLSDTVQKIRKLAPQLSLLGVVLTQFARAELVCNQVEAMLRKNLGSKLFTARVRVNTKAKAAPAVHKTIFDYELDPQGRGTQDFTQLASEFLARLSGDWDEPPTATEANG